MDSNYSLLWFNLLNCHCYKMYNFYKRCYSKWNFNLRSLERNARTGQQEHRSQGNKTLNSSHTITEVVETSSIWPTQAQKRGINILGKHLWNRHSRFVRLGRVLGLSSASIETVYSQLSMNLTNGFAFREFHQSQQPLHPGQRQATCH